MSKVAESGVKSDELGISEDGLFQLMRLLHGVIDGPTGMATREIFKGMFQEYGDNILGLWVELIGDDEGDIPAKCKLSDSQVLNFFLKETYESQPTERHRKELARLKMLIESDRRMEASKLATQLHSQWFHPVLRSPFRRQIEAKDMVALRAIYHDLKTCTDFEMIHGKYPKVSKKYLRRCVEGNRDNLCTRLQHFLSAVYYYEPVENRAQCLELFSALFLAASQFHQDHPSWKAIKQRVSMARKKLNK